METKIETFYLIGIAVKTINAPGKAEIDIPQLWQKFMHNDILSKISNKESDDIYSVYTDYEGDYTQPYTTVLACKVKSLDTIPDGMVGLSIQSGLYQQFTAKGKLSDGIVVSEWLKIWQSNMNRSYLTDFEIYGSKAEDKNNAEVDIFVGINSKS